MATVFVCLVLVVLNLEAAEVWGLKGASLLRLDQKSASVALPWIATDFALSQSRSMLLLRGSCSNGMQQLWSRSPLGVIERIRFPEDGLPKWGRPLISDLSISRSGRFGAFVVRRCNASGQVRDASDEVGAVFVVDLMTLAARLIHDSLDSGGYPKGVAMLQGFSPDERFLLVNYEGGFEVFDASRGRKIIGDEYLPNISDGQYRAAGWLTNQCLVIQQFPIVMKGLQGQSHLLFWNRKPVMLIKSILAPSLISFDYPLALTRDKKSWEVTSILDNSIVLSVPLATLKHIRMLGDESSKVSCSSFVANSP